MFDWSIPDEILQRARRAGAVWFVETGYGAGQSLRKAAAYFDDVYSIEIDVGIARRAMVEKIEHVVLGDSVEWLPQVLCMRPDRALIWLDAHHSGPGTGGVGSALRGELAALAALERRDHVIAVDDLIECDGTRGYPTQDGLVAALREINPAYTIDVQREARQGRGYVLAGIGI